MAFSIAYNGGNLPFALKSIIDLVEWHWQELAATVPLCHSFPHDTGSGACYYLFDDIISESMESTIWSQTLTAAHVLESETWPWRWHWKSSWPATHKTICRMHHSKVSPGLSWPWRWWIQVTLTVLDRGQCHHQNQSNWKKQCCVTLRNGPWSVEIKVAPASARQLKTVAHAEST